uniref:Ribosomal protein S12 n=1 Tax=Dictyomenia sonderi TaxID=2007178 RepID=UPI0022FD8B86|nr:Ribosomal protein S12 [Dictyomenia sonderi]WAX04269.1 Ribosomal protein S12 [Dictyomenia sonderi]
MATLKQLISSRLPKKKNKKRNTILHSSPQRKAICLKVYTLNPKKPNSAERKVAKVKFSNGKTIIGYIPGEGHSLQQHSIVLVEGGRVKDLPGIKFRFIKGTLDFL